MPDARFDEWIAQRYERLWSERFAALDVVLEDLKREHEGDGGNGR
jgi:hypothetical protein